MYTVRFSFTVLYLCYTGNGTYSISSLEIDARKMRVIFWLWRALATKKTSHQQIFARCTSIG